MRKTIRLKNLLWSLRDTLDIVNNQEKGFHVHFEDNLSFSVFYNFMKHKSSFYFKETFQILLAYVKYTSMRH